jgi:hypothetical protein
VDRPRQLIVTADDFGIGPGTSRGILELAAQGHVTATVLLVNSPHAVDAMAAFHRADTNLALGWHVCLTLDRPVLPAGQVPSLVQPDGSFWPLGHFIARLLRGRIKPAELSAELHAQYRRFIELVGCPPLLVNSHHHVHCLAPVGRLLLDVLARQRPLPYIRQVREPWRLLLQVPGARLKRAVLSLAGRRMAHQQAERGFPGNDWLVGIANPAQADDPDFFRRWLRRVPGQVVELLCHPGRVDTTLAGRDGSHADGLLRRRLRERALLAQPGFLEEVGRAGFRLTAPSRLAYSHAGRGLHVGMA